MMRVVVVAAGWLLAAGAVRADSEFALERFHPGVDSESIFDVDGGGLIEPLAFDVSLWANAAVNPLRGSNGAPIIEERQAAHLVAAFGLLPWLQLGLEVPVVIAQSGNPAAAASITGAGLAGAGVGDVRLTPKLALLRRADVGIDLALLPTLTLSTGAPAGGFLSDQAPTLVPELLGSTTLGPVRVGVDLGVRLRAERPFLDLSVGHELVYRAGAGLRLHDLLRVPVEVDLTLKGALAATRPFADARESPLEALLGVTINTPGGVQWFAGAGGGAGLGAPDRRVVLGVRFAPRAPPPPQVISSSDDDDDDDGALDHTDRCPFEPETRNGVRDDDGCPEDPRVTAVATVTTTRAAAAGAPVLARDGDGDGLADDVDVCPGRPEDGDTFEDGDGCPEPDNDGDGLADDDDGCPLSAETSNDFDDDDGCPDVPPAELRGLVGAVAGITFDNDSARLTAAAIVLLQDVRTALQRYPMLALHIEGHASRDGDPARNLALSAARAHAVRAWLVAAGIAPARLQDAGHGDTRPVDVDDSPAAHARNRRVVLTYKTMGERR